MRNWVSIKKGGKVGCYFEVYLLMFKNGNFKEYVIYSNMSLFFKREKQVFYDRFLLNAGFDWHSLLSPQLYESPLQYVPCVCILRFSAYLGAGETCREKPVTLLP